MPTNLYSFVGIYARGLDALSHILSKGAEFAKAKGVSEAEMLNWRLIDDMMPLGGQIKMAHAFSAMWLARAAGETVPDFLPDGLTLPQYQEAIKAAKAHFAAFKPEQFEGRDGVQLTVNIGPMEPTLPVSQWITGLATPSFYFHLTTAYAILRSKGVPIGKLDFFPAGL